MFIMLSATSVSECVSQISITLCDMSTKQVVNIWQICGLCLIEVSVSVRHIHNKTTESNSANLKRVCVSRRSISLLGWHFNKIGDFISGKFNVSMSLTEEYQGIRVTWQTAMLVSQDGGHWLDSIQNTNSKSDNEFSKPNKCDHF